MKFAFIHAEKAAFPIAPMCRLLGVTRQGYYAYAGRPPPQQRPAEVALRAEISRIHEESRGTYGSPRTLAALRAAGFSASKNRQRLHSTLGYKTPNQLETEFAARAA